ncbi:MAG: copper amine oxidase N-terminal domain-containing protein [Heliobacteriaceae bacterium]|nr:copper amine oxidase N-terminal domain-containing protein [Heliobacteriaceae bacterium]
MKKKWLFVIGVVVLTGLFAATAFAGNPIKLMINGQEIKPDVPPQIINGRTMVPIRWVTEALGANVEWDNSSNAVLINQKTSSPSPLITKPQVATLIQKQGKSNNYYYEGLSFELVNLDGDDDLEIAANIVGGVHIGQFFIFKKDLHGDYKLITEQPWKVERWNFRNPIEIEGKKLFEIVTRTGGTGVSVLNAHLVYLEQEHFVDAWQGTLLEECFMIPESYYKRIGSYQLDTHKGDRLYVWETAYQLEQDMLTSKGEVKTTTTVYLFDGQKFIAE